MLPCLAELLSLCRVRPRERTVGDRGSGPRSLNVEPQTTTRQTEEERQRTQLPPVGSHHQVLEQNLPSVAKSSELPQMNRNESSDGEKQPPEPKKIKLEKPEPDTQADSPMLSQNHDDQQTNPNPTPAFEPHQVFDLTKGDEDDDGLDELSKCADAPVPPSNPTASGAFPNLTRNLLGVSAEGNMPDWLRGLTESLQGLHVKSDKTHEYCVQLGGSVAQHDTRLAHLEAVAKETIENHEATVDRIAALEKSSY